MASHALLALVTGCTDLTGNLPDQSTPNHLFQGTPGTWTTCAMWAQDAGWNYDDAVGAGTYDPLGAGFDTDGYPECSPLDERYIKSCVGMPAPTGTVAQGYWQCEVGGYAYNTGTNHGATFGPGYQTYYPAKTDDPNGVNYDPSKTGLKGMNQVRALCPVACGTCPAESTAARKDPHLWFAHGGKADFRGEDGAIYNLLSAKNLSMNVAIKYADFHMRKALVHGSAMDAAYIVAQTVTGQLVKVEYNATNHRHVAVVTNGAKVTKVGAGDVFQLEGLRVTLNGNASKELIVKTPKWSLHATSSAFPYAHQNPGKVLLDIKIEPTPGYEPAKDVVAPHGIIGQSYDGDAIGIDGAMDAHVFTGEAKEVTTEAQAEGAIEGTIKDYKMASPFQTAFPFSRFDSARASPRNATKLSGKRVNVAIQHMTGGTSSPVEDATDVA